MGRRFEFIEEQDQQKFKDQIDDYMNELDIGPEDIKFSTYLKDGKVVYTALIIGPHPPVV